SEDNTLALCLEDLEDITVRIFFHDFDVNKSSYLLTIFKLALHHACRRCRERKFMDDQSM
ncbi:407_t:CDS:1, partial [Gigaspora rosea]